MSHKLLDLQLEEVSLVDDPANSSARVLLLKRKVANVKECPECGAAMKGGKCANKECGYEMDKAKRPEGDNMTDADKAKAAEDLKAAVELAQEAQNKAEVAEKRARAAEDEVAKLKNTPEEIEKRKLDALPADVKKRLEDAETVIKAMRDERETAEVAAIVKSMPGIKGTDEERVKMLKAIKATAPAEAFSALVESLKGTSVLVEKSAHFKTFAASERGSNADPESAIVAKVAEALKADPKMSYGDALAKVTRDNPELYNEHRAANTVRG